MTAVASCITAYQENGDTKDNYFSKDMRTNVIGNADDNYRSKPSSATNSLLRAKTESCCIQDSAASKQSMKAKPTLYDNFKAERNLINDKESNIRKTFLRMNPALANNNHSASHSQIVVFRDDYCI